MEGVGLDVRRNCYTAPLQPRACCGGWTCGVKGVAFWLFAL